MKWRAPRRDGGLFALHDEGERSFSTPRCRSGRGGLVEKGDAPEERIFKFCLVGPGELWCVSAQEDQAVQGDPERGSGEEGVFRA